MIENHVGYAAEERTPIFKKVISKKSELKIKRILESAFTLFINKGYASVSMDSIAMQACVSKQTIYHHFNSKDNLFLKAISSQVANFPILNYQERDISDIHLLLNNIALEYIDMVTTKSAMALYKTCSYESAIQPDLSKNFYDLLINNIIESLENLMSRLVDEGHIQVKNTRFAALHFFHLIRGEFWLQQEFSCQSQISIDERKSYTSDTIDMFLKAYSISK